jgi:hypothetical protein
MHLDPVLFSITISRLGKRFLIEDAKEELDQPGEFYYDRQSRELIYLPTEGEQLAAGFEAWAPQLITPLSVKAENVMVEKLSVVHAAADMDGFFEGDCDGQSASNLHTGAILINASKVKVSEVEVAHAGGFGASVIYTQHRVCDLIC